MQSKSTLVYNRYEQRMLEHIIYVNSDDKNYRTQGISVNNKNTKRKKRLILVLCKLLNLLFERIFNQNNSCDCLSSLKLGRQR